MRQDGIGSDIIEGYEESDALPQTQSNASLKNTVPNAIKDQSGNVSDVATMFAHKYLTGQIVKGSESETKEHFGSLRSAVNAHQQSAMDRIDYTKKKYTE